MSGRLPDLYTGDSYPVDVLLEADGAPEDLTGALIAITLVTDAQDEGVPVLQHVHTVPAGALASEGIARTVVPVALTADLVPGRYRIFLRRIRPDNPPDVWTFLTQTLRVRFSPEVAT